MKDEEMAEEYAKKAFCVAHTHEDELIFKNGFLAGLKAGRPQWHDLRKDKNDLPKATTPVLVMLENGVPYISHISTGKRWFCTNYYTGEDKVIAWCEIPTFDKE